MVTLQCITYISFQHPQHILPIVTSFLLLFIAILLLLFSQLDVLKTAFLYIMMQQMQCSCECMIPYPEEMTPTLNTTNNYTSPVKSSAAATDPSMQYFSMACSIGWSSGTSGTRGSGFQSFTNSSFSCTQIHTGADILASSPSPTSPSPSYYTK